MRSSTALSLIDGAHYLFLGIWLGAIVMLAVSAPITFRVVRAYQPALQAEPYNQPELADRAAPILAGAIVGNILRGLSVIQVVCALGVGATLTARRVLTRRIAMNEADESTEIATPSRATTLAMSARTSLLIIAVLILLIDRSWLTPRIWQTRFAMYDSTQTQAIRDDARARFDGLHKTSERLVATTALSLAVALVLTPLALRRNEPDDSKNSPTSP